MKTHIDAHDKIVGIAARDAFGFYGLVAGTNCLTFADMLAMALSGKTPSGNSVVAIFTSESEMGDYLRSREQ